MTNVVETVLLSPGCNFPEAQAAGAGLIVARDAQAIAASLQQLLSAPEELRQMGENGRALVQIDECAEARTAVEEDTRS